MKSLVGGMLALMAAGAVYAQGAWLPSGDNRLRNDVTLLADEGVIRVPVSSWPIPIDDIARALARVDVESIKEPGLQNALLRVQSRVLDVAVHQSGVRDVTLTAGRPGLLRSYEELGREEAEARIRTGASTGQWSTNLALTVVSSPADGKRIRFDGSDLTLRAGNWLISANSFDRWYGPGRDGSLILSGNARPMIGVSIDRALSIPFPIPLLHWLGPWRFQAYAATMEGHRPDVDRPVFMAMRATFKPLQILELGLSRSMQFCGKDRPCDVETFGRVLLGQDNAGIRGLASENEPGNQMAGFDARLVSPFSSLPFALFAQLIGEDSSSTTIPEKYLAIFGLEGWGMLDGGSVLRARIEYSDTTCSYGNNAYPDCAYDQGIFFAGYRFRGRGIGHTTDSDSEMFAAGLGWTLPGGDELRLDARRAHLDRFGAPDENHSIVAGFNRYYSLEAAWRTRVMGEEVALKLGAERIEPNGAASRNRAYGFLSWQRRL
ncbi:MAG: capsule assembly Wzi family protein [Steroidobacteraceae bacterium]